MEWLLDNFSVVATIVLFIAGIVLRERRRAWFEWANEVLFMAFDSAEKRGILEGIPDIAKLQHYLDIWRHEYRKQFGKDPSEADMMYAVTRAAELSQREKQIREMVAVLADPKS